MTHSFPTRRSSDLRERPKIDRIACPWFIRRFVDREALIHYVPQDWVIATAEEIAAIPFAIPDVEFSHNGEACSFDAFITRSGLSDPALPRLAALLRGPDAARPALAPQRPGLCARSVAIGR